MPFTSFIRKSKIQSWPLVGNVFLATCYLLPGKLPVPFSGRGNCACTNVPVLRGVLLSIFTAVELVIGVFYYP